MDFSIKVEVVFPFVPVTPINFSFFEGLSNRLQLAIARACLIFFTATTGIFSETFNSDIFVFSSTTIAEAPFSKADGIKSVPFFTNPLIAKNNPFSFIDLESDEILVISISLKFTFFMISTFSKTFSKFIKSSSFIFCK